MPRRLLATVLLSLAVMAPARAFAQQAASLTVTVTDAATGVPVTDAFVRVGNARERTGVRGTATFGALSTGAATVVVQRVGYSSDSVRTTLAAGAANHVEVGLALSPVVLARLHATAESLPRSFLLRDFYIRKATWGSGYFIDRRRIAEQHGATFTELLRLVPNTYLITDPDNQQTYLRFNKVYTFQTGGDCPPTYYLDGQLFQVPADADLDREFSPGEIEGIEVYTGARVPPQYNGSRALCGVVVIWTRER
ncbi:MAG TPA: hypothetical protein VF771_03450 [Longimicrobiaceae bacterium]